MEDPSCPPLPPKMRSRVSISHDSPLSATETGATVLVRPPRDDLGLVGFPEVQGSQTADCPLVTRTSATAGHVVTIRINPENGEVKTQAAGGTLTSLVQQTHQTLEHSVTVTVASEPVGLPQSTDGSIRINVSSNEDEMLQRTAMAENFIKSPSDRNNPYFFYGAFPCATTNMVMSSGQCSPSDTLDSGTCSDLDSTPPPLPKKKSSGVTVTIIGAQHKRASSLTSSGAEVDSDDNESNISCDSLNSGDLNGTLVDGVQGVVIQTPSSPGEPEPVKQKSALFLPQGLLKDIRDRPAKPDEVSNDNDEVLTDAPTVKQFNVLTAEPTLVKQCTYEERQSAELKLTEVQIEDKQVKEAPTYLYESDKYYKFHLNEHVVAEDKPAISKNLQEDESFAGYKDILGDEGTSTIRSAKGTVRGVKNRVRAGIATFLQINSAVKSYKEKDAGKVVVYTTTMGIVRKTYHECLKVKQIMRTHLVKFEERDVFMSSECQAEIRDRMQCDQILVPQVFVDGHHIGDAETVERLNENGELRRILKPYKSADACSTCSACGGYRLLPCPVCNGSKKSVHRNHFTTEFVALKCMNCDEVGLVRCSSC